VWMIRIFSSRGTAFRHAGRCCVIEKKEATVM